MESSFQFLVHKKLMEWPFHKEWAFLTTWESPFPQGNTKIGNTHFIPSYSHFYLDIEIENQTRRSQPLVPRYHRCPSHQMVATAASPLDSLRARLSPLSLSNLMFCCLFFSFFFRSSISNSQIKEFLMNFYLKLMFSFFRFFCHGQFD